MNCCRLIKIASNIEYSNNCAFSRIVDPRGKKSRALLCHPSLYCLVNSGTMKFILRESLKDCYKCSWRINVIILNLFAHYLQKAGVPRGKPSLLRIIFETW